ncbi:DUF3299 domain-containing protein [Mesorhizobium tamadayense]|uniref:DUF3299 domain-containing protein n=1 Tax=Mesorhizobium tamadayense TaxID=425306 RepID=UPI00315DA2E6
MRPPSRRGTLSSDLAGVVVRLEGYVLPIDREQDLVYEFLLVPWLGACSHAPQPPPNQMVHVIPSAPFRIAHAYEFVSVIGTVHSLPGLHLVSGRPRPPSRASSQGKASML